MSTATYTPVGIPAVKAPRDLSLAKSRSAADGASRSGIWVGIFAITMSFAAFTSALFVREGAAGDWTRLTLPSILYANTAALLLSSLTLERSRRSLAAQTQSRATPQYITSAAAHNAIFWLGVTLALGLLFIVGQYQAWRELAAQGLFLATNANSSFFYVFTGMHILHLLGGVAALVYTIGQLVGSHSTFRRARFENTAIYWHFMGILWVYLLFVLRTRL
jgi:cytochrome c oxidase subunit 3